MTSLAHSKERRNDSGYEKMLSYLKQDGVYWMNNDIWDFKEDFFVGRIMYGTRYIDFRQFTNIRIKNEMKYYVIFNFKEKYIIESALTGLSQRMSLLSRFIGSKFPEAESMGCLEEKGSFLMRYSCYIRQNGVQTETSINTCCNTVGNIYDFFSHYYDEREETDKDIWYFRNIPGAKVSVTQQNKLNQLDFTVFPQYYREMVKRYFRTIITKRSSSHCTNVFYSVEMFFRVFYEMGYGDGFLEHLSRADIEQYLYELSNRFKDRNVTYYNKFISYPRTFMEYIQLACYKGVPKKEAASLIFEDDIPKRERDSDRLKRVRFIPEPVMKQLDANIMELDRPEYIPMYILLRETGWRGADILNLRYDSCLEKIWNAKEQRYTSWLCGEITKTGIALLKIPIRDSVSEMLEAAIHEAEAKSMPSNNPEKYLFVNYTRKRKGEALSKGGFVGTVKRLIQKKDIRDGDGKLYPFRTHSLRHTRAKEYVEQGVGISIIQEILGHQSLQMTIHYAMVSENLVYEKWKRTESLDIFRLNEKSASTVKAVASNSAEQKIRYEYVKKSLDAVKVPFGVCFKASKLPCRQQSNHCLTCAGFCSTSENLPEYEVEIERIRNQIAISESCDRSDWAKKNQDYLDLLEKTQKEIQMHGIVHKNGASREDDV